MPRHTGYHMTGLNPSRLKNAVDKVSEQIVKLKPAAIAVRGASGLLVGAPVSMVTGIPLILVRKEWEADHSHSSYAAEAWTDTYNPFDSYVILDDFISRGETVRRIVKALQKESRIVSDVEPLGIVLYASTKDFETFPIEVGMTVPVFHIYA